MAETATKTGKAVSKQNATLSDHLTRRNIPLHLMVLPALVLVILFSYLPMVGIVIAFQDFHPVRGFFRSEWVGLDNFRYVFRLPNIIRVFRNTITIAFMKMVAGLVVPLLVALLLNEVAKNSYKRVAQTLIYLPHFLSWVILGGVLIDLLSPSQGVINKAIQLIGFKSVFFLGDNRWFPFVLVATNTWKEFGFGTIIYMAGLAGIDPNLYEAAIVDGANRWKQTLHITLPGLIPLIVLLATLSLRNVLNAGFDQVFNLYNPLVYESGDIIDTFIYRLGLISAQFAAATAVGLFRGVVSSIFIVVSYLLAYKFANYRIF